MIIKLNLIFRKVSKTYLVKVTFFHWVILFLNYIYSSTDNNLLYDNTASYNEEHGIYLSGADDNILLSNEANNNDENGIHLLNSIGNTLMGNTANNNNNGTYLETSNNNIVINNIFLGNDVCYNETGSTGNIFKDNICTSAELPAVPLDPFILGLIFGLVIGFGALAAVLLLFFLRGRKKK